MLTPAVSWTKLAHLAAHSIHRCLINKEQTQNKEKQTNYGFIKERFLVSQVRNSEDCANNNTFLSKAFQGIKK